LPLSRTYRYRWRPFLRLPSMPQRLWFVLLLTCLAATTSVPVHARPQYELDYLVEFRPDDGTAAVTISVEPRDGRLVHIDFAMDGPRYAGIEGDGEVTRSDARLLWVPPRAGGSLHYSYRIDHERGNDGFDARITDEWTILRGDDLVPPAKVRTTKGADSRARLRFELPEGWNSVDTQYRASNDRKSFVVVNRERRFDRPTGWIIAGDLGVRREDIGDTHVSVAAPRGEAYPRLEILGYINAVADDLRSLGELPSKLLIVGAGDPMWRGGLSAPRSLWMHSSRPLISENGTSALLHELFHVVTGIRGESGEDWIAEGLAEYYAITLLNRAGLLSDARRDKALEWMQHHGRKVKTLHAKRSSGSRTARAVTLFAELDVELRKHSDGNLDDVVKALSELDRRISFDDLQEQVRTVAGAEAEVLKAAPVR